MTPKPPLKRRSILRMGGGLTISKKRNKTNAQLCALISVGEIITSTNQIAMISSHTIAP